MSFDIVQRSENERNSKIEANTKITVDEKWKDVKNILDIQYKARLGHPRVVNIIIANPNNREYANFKAYQRIRILEQKSMTPIFLGRVERLKPIYEKGALSIMCRDYMGDMADRTNVAQNISGNRRSEIVQKIIDGEEETINSVRIRKGGVYKPSVSAPKWQQSVQTDLHIDKSIYTGKIERNYGNGESGFESIIESIKRLSVEESWDNVQVVLQTGTGGSATYSLLTGDILSGAGIKKPENGNTLYIGVSNKPTGFQIATSANTGSDINNNDVEVAYSASVGFTDYASSDTSIKNVLNDDTGGRLWSSLPTTNLWIKKAHGSLDFDKDDLNIAQNEFENSFNDLFWIRVKVTASVSSDGSVNAMNQLVAGKSFGNIYSIVPTFDTLANENTLESGWDYRIEDPHHLVKHTRASSGWIFLGSPYKFTGIEIISNSKIDLSSSQWTIYTTGSTGQSPINIDDQGTENFRVWDVSSLTSWDKKYISGRILDGVNSNVNTDALYWIEIRKNSALTDEEQNDLQFITAPAASLKYFERGTEPWDVKQNTNGKPRGRKVRDDINSNRNDSDKELDETGKLLANNLARFSWRNYSSSRGSNRFRIISYSLGENNFEIVTRVTVIGRNGVNKTVINSAKESELGIVKEKVYTDNWDLKTENECEIRARTLLKQLGANSNINGTDGFRFGEISLPFFPVYKDRLGMYRAVREGDTVLLTIKDSTYQEAAGRGQELKDEPVLVFEIEYDSKTSLVKLRIVRDLVYNTLDNNSLSDSLYSAQRLGSAASWDARSPSERSANEIIWHNQVGEYSPKGRMRFNQYIDDNNIENDDYSTIDFDRFTGSGTSEVTDDSNWETNLRIMQNAGGALLFKGERNTTIDTDKADALVRDELDRFDDNSGGDNKTGVLYYNASTQTLRTAASTQDVLLLDGSNQIRSMQSVVSGEWGGVLPLRRAITQPKLPSTDTGDIPTAGTQVISGVTHQTLAVPKNILDNADFSYGVVLFENDREYIGTGSDKRNPPLVLLTSDSSNTGSHYNVVIAHWITRTVTYSQTNIATYYKGFIVRFIAGVSAGSHVHRLTIPGGGGDDNIQLSVSGSGTNAHGIITSSRDSSNTENIYINTGETENIAIAGSIQQSVERGVSATYMVIAPPRNYLFPAGSTITSGLPDVVRSTTYPFTARQSVQGASTGYIVHQLTDDSRDGFEKFSTFTLTFKQDTAITGLYEFDGSQASNFIYTLNGRTNAYNIDEIILEFQRKRITISSLDNFTLQTKLTMKFASNDDRNNFIANGNKGYGVFTTISGLEIKNSIGNNVINSPSIATYLSVPPVSRTTPGSDIVFTKSRTITAGDPFMNWLFNNINRNASIQFSITKPSS